ncbi:MurR/RpiR family transcriptional regulator [Humibacter albus]|jgi:DNA-binding MurR/RpiR family transcriptional regulator|uniref:MurR/RpiR family transcriptional regulator n=1 Tax=Humibacter albus TaxID=427754 RepID=UPI0003B2ED94|nr:MurR/RpiR family transcriptional regulator [Humibacter albus]
MTPSKPGEVLATIRSLLPSLLPTEQTVAQVLLSRSNDIVELSSQQIADLAGASRATVVRTCQSLGFSGYQQLRVLLARDAGYQDPEPAPPASAPDDAVGIVTETFRHVAASVPGMLALLDDDEVARAVDTLASANRVLVVGNGLSAPTAVDAAARFTSIGRPAEAPTDVIGQQISARLLGPGDAVLLFSGSGANASTQRVAMAASTAGASVILVTSFARSPLTQSADIALVVTMPDLTFREEITLTSRLPQAILVQGIVAALTSALGERAERAKALALDAISDNLVE